MFKRTRRVGVLLVIAILLLFPNFTDAGERDETRARFSISECLPILFMDGVFEFPLIDITPLYFGYGSWNLTYLPTNDRYLWFYLSSQAYFNSIPQNLMYCSGSIPVFYFNTTLEEFVLHIPEFYFNQSFYGELNLIYYGQVDGYHLFYAY